MSQNGSTAALIAKAAAAAAAEKKQRQQQKSGVGRAREREARAWAAGSRQQESLSLDFICVQKISISPFCCASLCVSALLADLQRYSCPTLW